MAGATQRRRPEKRTLCHDPTIPRATYDSSLTPSARDDALELWKRRRLVGVVARRQLQLRYQGSILGVWWTLVQPLLEMAVLWVVFSSVFRFSTPDAPYVVYLLSGLSVAALVRNAILAIASSLNVNSGLLTRVRVPSGLFAVAALLDTFVAFSVGLAPLLLIMLVVGPGISLTTPLVLIPAAFAALFALGIGLALAPLAARFPDTIVLTGVLLTLVTYLAPVFYPISIVPDAYVALIHLNPLYYFISIFRANLYEDAWGDITDYVVVIAVAGASLAVGAAIFRRYARTVLMHL
jgi:ABC-type polysaccharide/polyol phosphate export permease